MIYGGQLFATAVTNEGIADLFAERRYRPLFTRLAHEIVAVALAEGVRLESFNGFDPKAFLPGASPSETARSFDDMVAHNRRSAKTHSGIWRDLAIRKRRTEVDAQLGPAVEIGRRHGLALPITARTIDLIHEIEAGRRRIVDRQPRRAGQHRVGCDRAGMNIGFGGRTAIVTGAAHGFGRAIAIAFATARRTRLRLRRARRRAA